MNAPPREPQPTPASVAKVRLSLEVEVDGSGTISGPGGSLPVHSDDPMVRDFLLLLLRETGGSQVQALLATFGYQSRASYYDKLKRYLAGGIAALAATPPGPRHKWRRSDEVIRRIVAARFHNPHCSPQHIVSSLAAAGFTVSLRSVQRTLTEYGLVTPRHCAT